MKIVIYDAELELVREEEVTPDKAWEEAEDYQYAGYTVQVIDTDGNVLSTLIAK